MDKFIVETNLCLRCCFELELGFGWEVRARGNGVDVGLGARFRATSKLRIKFRRRFGYDVSTRCLRMGPVLTLALELGQ